MRMANDSQAENLEDINITLTAWPTHPNTLAPYPALQYFFVTALAIQGILGTLGNILVIGAICVVPALRTPSNAFILNLSLADLMVTCVTQPSSILGAILGQDYFDRRWLPCNIIGTLCAMGCIASCWNICMISVNRFVMICYFEIYDKVYTKAKTFLFCVAVWIIVFIINTPNHAGWGDTRFSTVFYVCTFANHVHSYAIFFIGVGVIIPVGVSFLAYLGIYLKVRNSSLVRNRILAKRDPEAESCRTAETTVKMSEISSHMAADPVTASAVTGDQSKPRQTMRDFHRNVRVAKALFRVFIIFLIMWLPVGILILLGLGSSVKPVWYILTVLMAHGNSSLNCIVYALSLDHFREGYLRVLGLRRTAIYPKRKSFAGGAASSGPSNGGSGRKPTLPAIVVSAQDS